MAFAANNRTPNDALVLGLIHQDYSEVRHLKTYKLFVTGKQQQEQQEFSAGPFQFNNLDPGASHLIPASQSLGGFVVLGEQRISFINGRTPSKSQSISPTIFNCHCSIDDAGSQFLLGDHEGRLFKMELISTTPTHPSRSGEAEGKFVSLKLLQIGRSSIPSTLQYIWGGFAFVGSHFGDSQLLKLHNEPTIADDQNPNCFWFTERVDCLTNLAPITDFVVTQFDGQSQLVTCSGGYGDSSLRIVRNGIRVHEYAALELQYVTGAFSLRSHFSAM